MVASTARTALVAAAKPASSENVRSWSSSTAARWMRQALALDTAPRLLCDCVWPLERGTSCSARQHNLARRVRRRSGGGRNVTFRARQYSVNGERRSFALLRPIADTAAQERVRDLVLQAYAESAATATEAASSTGQTADAARCGVRIIRNTQLEEFRRSWRALTGTTM